LWLKAIGKRTPKGYFLFLALGSILSLLPLIVRMPGNQPLLPFNPELLTTYLEPLLLLALALACNRIFVVSDVFSRNTLWPGHSYLLLLILFSLDIPLWKAASHGLVGLLIIFNILRIQYNQDARFQVFNIGFLIGVAAFLGSIMLLMAPFLLFGMRTLKPLNLKEYVLFILGLATPFYFLWGYCFLTADFILWNELFKEQEWFVFNTFNLSNSLRWSLLLILVLFSSSLLFFRFNSMQVRFRRLVSAISYMLVGCIIVALSGGLETATVYYIAPCLAVYGTMLMLRYT
jgi:hypothetical protein